MVQGCGSSMWSTQEIKMLLKQKGVKRVKQEVDDRSKGEEGRKMMIWVVTNSPEIAEEMGNKRKDDKGYVGVRGRVCQGWLKEKAKRRNGVAPVFGDQANTCAKGVTGPQCLPRRGRIPGKHKRGRERRREGKEYDKGKRFLGRRERER